jgi:antirepressor protein
MMTDDWNHEDEELAASVVDETNGADVPEEQPVDQQIVPFMGNELAAAMTAGGTIYITFPGMCTALGLNVRGQTQRVQRTRTLRQALRRIPLETRGGLQRINCLRVDKLALWLAGVQTSQIKPRYREKIEAYQDELAPVLSTPGRCKCRDYLASHGEDMSSTCDARYGGMAALCLPRRPCVGGPWRVPPGAANSARLHAALAEIRAGVKAKPCGRGRAAALAPARFSAVYGREPGKVGRTAQVALHRRPSPAWVLWGITAVSHPTCG